MRDLKHFAVRYTLNSCFSHWNLDHEESYTVVYFLKGNCSSKYCTVLFHCDAVIDQATWRFLVSHSEYRKDHYYIVQISPNAIFEGLQSVVHFRVYLCPLHTFCCSTFFFLFPYFFHLFFVSLRKEIRVFTQQYEWNSRMAACLLHDPLHPILNILGTNQPFFIRWIRDSTFW